jgi:hypothetical protein
MGTEVFSQENMCEQYRSGDITRNQIAVFSSLEDMSDNKPDELKEIFYRQEYVKQPHIRGSFGRYPPPDYELDIRFEINIDTGRPIPQSSQGYTRKYKTNRDFSVKISNTRASLAQHLPPQVALPIEGYIAIEDYEVIGAQYGMQEVSYLDAIEQKDAGDYAFRTNKYSNIFLDWRAEELHSFMRCQKITDAMTVPHCKYFEIIDGFLAETHFKRVLIDDFETIRRLSTEFVTCLFKEN